MLDKELRKKLGALLLVERIQVKGWNELGAAKAAQLTTKTIRRIERGGNFEWESLEKYAAALGHPLVYWFREVLQETQRSAEHADTAGREFQSAAKPPRRRAESDDRERHA